LKSAATTKEIANVVMFLVSNKAAYVSGADLLVAGGWQG
jgi:NAD(P)-dependent dehydrogenase (short-subunit alcohol dehydrogenase family)